VGILVTGATGFLGRHLVPLLLARGEPVRAFVRPGTDDDELTRLGVEVVRGELSDAETLRGAAEGCAAVFHLAGVVAHERSDLPRLVVANVEGARCVGEAVEPGTRLVHVSSVAAIGPAPGPDRPADETQPFPAFAHRFPYAETKRLGEQAVLAAAARGVEPVIACSGFLIGPGDVYQVSTWHVKRYLRGQLRYHAPGGLSYVDARDVAAGLVALAERGRSGERYVLTNPEGNLSHAAFFHRVGKVTGVRRAMVPLPRWFAPLAAKLVRWPVKPGEVAAAVNWWFYTPAKAERELGFTTRPLDETIAETACQYIGT
jgi:dihydroflavonol-4-reductase